MKVLCRAVAVLAALLVMPAAVQANVAPRTPLTVTKATTVPTNQVFTFQLAGPKCDHKSINQTFTLTSGESKVFAVCDSPPDKAHRFTVTELATPGWQLGNIECSGTDKDPKDAFIIEAPTAFIEFSPGEKKACTFTNAPVPPPVVVTPPTPPQPVAAPAPPVATPPTAVPNTPVSVPANKPPKKAKKCVHGRVRFDSHGHRLRDSHGRKISVCRQIKKPVRKPNFTG